MAFTSSNRLCAISPLIKNGVFEGHEYKYIFLENIGNIKTFSYYGSEPVIIDIDGNLQSYHRGNFTAIECVHRIVTSSCSSCHSITIDNEGNLYNNMTIISSDNDYITVNCDEHPNNDLFTMKMRVQIFNKYQKTIFSTVACGKNYMIAIDEQGNLWNKGKNNCGQLGVNDIYDRNKLSRNFRTGTTFVAISCGDSHTIALDVNGHIWSSGYNFYGQLGLDDFDNRNIFTLINFPTTFQTISCGMNHTAFIDIEGNIWTTGLNCNYQLGFLDYNNRNTLNKISRPGTYFTSVACGASYTIALDADGYFWNTQFDRGGQIHPFPQRNHNFDKILNNTVFVCVSTVPDNRIAIAIDIDHNLWIYSDFIKTLTMADDIDIDLACHQKFTKRIKSANFI